MDSAVESILQVWILVSQLYNKSYNQMFIMTLGGFADIWEEIPNTEHVLIGMNFFDKKVNE